MNKSQWESAVYLVMNRFTKNMLDCPSQSFRLIDHHQQQTINSKSLFDQIYQQPLGNSQILGCSLSETYLL